MLVWLLCSSLCSTEQRQTTNCLISYENTQHLHTYLMPFMTLPQLDIRNDDAAYQYQENCLLKSEDLHPLIQAFPLGFFSGLMPRRLSPASIIFSDANFIRWHDSNASDEDESSPMATAKLPSVSPQLYMFSPICATGARCIIPAPAASSDTPDTDSGLLAFSFIDFAISILRQQHHACICKIKPSREEH
mmetsp:Transcript_13898/g.40647  ORF Transcript_13898/g.40647 Transcript_13898/m.40647 type:complete len:190 (-) Transcript_13898:947-1516(-)